jgi:cytidine deaminase
MSLAESYKYLIPFATRAVKNAKVIKTSPVGCVIETYDGNMFSGFNIESRGFPILHAEIVATISAIILGYRKQHFRRMLIAYNFKGVYPSCACCRQFLWEHANPDMKVACINLTDNKINEFKLGELYPMPFPEEYEESKDDLSGK